MSSSSYIHNDSILPFEKEAETVKSKRPGATFHTALAEACDYRDNEKLPASWQLIQKQYEKSQRLKARRINRPKKAEAEVRTKASETHLQRRRGVMRRLGLIAPIEI